MSAQEQASGDIHEQLGFEQLIANVSAQVVSAPDDAFSATVVAAISEVVQRFGGDRGGILTVNAAGTAVYPSYGWYHESLTERLPETLNLAELMPWAAQRVVHDRLPLVVNTLADVPAEAARDRAAYVAQGIKSNIVIPLVIGGEVRYLFSMGALRREVRWPLTYVPRLQLLGETIANTIERRRMAEALRLSEARLGLAAESAGAGLWDLDIPTGRIWATPHAKALYGFDPDAEVDLEAVLAVVHPDDAGRLRGTVARVAASGGEFWDEYRVVLPGGVSRWINARGHGHTGARGDHCHVTGISIDVTARKRAEAEQRALEAQRLAAADAAGLGFYAMSDGGATTVADAKTRELLGIPPEQEARLRAFWLEHVHPADHDRVLEVSLRTIRGEVTSAAVDYRYQHPTRGTIWFSHVVRASETGPDGRVTRSVGVVQDITARKESEAALVTALADVQHLREQLERENVYLRQEAGQAKGRLPIVAQSPAMRHVMAEVAQVAATDSTVLLLGETGSGKELVASAIHESSPRRHRTMVRVNCAAIPTTLIEAELFGREKGAYTGALSKQIGRFEMSSGSTIFLDEVGDLPLDTQVKLLRVIQDRQIERLGSPRPIAVNLRIIAATNRDLTKAVREGSFREDLYYRLNVFPIRVPALRERRDDLPLLVEALVDDLKNRIGRHFTSVSRESLDRLSRYAWPGNVRELRNVIERAMILAPGPVLDIDMPDGGSGGPSSTRVPGMDRESVLEVLSRTGWRIRGSGGAAEVLGLKPTTLEARMARLGIKRP